MPQTDHDRERKFQIQLRMQIPDSCSEDTLHKSLKKKLVSSFSNAPLFQVNIQGLGTQMWILNAKLDNGALSTTSALRKKFRSPVQQAFEECLSPPDYASFIASFCKQGNNNRDFLKITADSDGPFPGPSHFWTDDGAVLPEFTSAIVDAVFRSSFWWCRPGIVFDGIDSLRGQDTLETSDSRRLQSNRHLQ